jgi:actin-related protein
MPLLSTILDTMFNRFQSPYISLISAPVMCAAAAGVRSALVVDMGWAETVATSIYEYREVSCSRSIRAGKMLVNAVHKLLARALREQAGMSAREEGEQLVSFDECEEVAQRLLWCKSAKKADDSTAIEGLPTVTETDETEQNAPRNPEEVTIPLRSTFPPTTITLSYDQLYEPVENSFFESQYALSSWDDHELPLPQLLFHQLLHLPLDVRAICMSRIIFTGGCAGVLGLRGRVFDDLAALVNVRGWDPVTGKGAEQYRANPKLKRPPTNTTTGTEAGSSPPPPPRDGPPSGAEVDGVWHDAANAVPAPSQVEEQVRRQDRGTPAVVKGRLRAVESLGAWAGASLLTQLRVAGVASVERELWLAAGAAGASRAADVDLKAQQRQSMGAPGLMRASAVQATNWTLGAWGNV